ncbi:MAG: hypothetical protein KJ749_13545, partial [Planctomycetes bacterium]|nr:hypothetical protein [Planctomycetota bacterium]
GGTYCGNGTWCACPSETSVPAVSEWGMIVMCLLVVAAAAIAFRRMRRQPA